MNQLHTEPVPAPQRMSQDEAKAVLDLWAEKQHAEDRDASMPRIEDLAEILGTPPETVSRLLEEVRHRRQMQAQAVSDRHAARGRARYRLTWTAAAVVCLALSFLVLIGIHSRRHTEARPAEAAVVQEYDAAATRAPSPAGSEIVIRGNGREVRITAPPDNPPPSQAAPPAPPAPEAPGR
jgi:hypothetical protein